MMNMNLLIWLEIILILITIGIYYLSKSEFWRAVFRKAPRDIKGLWRAIQFTVLIHYCQFRNFAVHEYFQKIIKRHPTKVCFYFEDQKWTFQEVEDMSNCIGNYFLAQGLKKGDKVGVFMENCPEFLMIWFGLSKIGVIPALINFNLRRQSLQHCLEAAQCKLLIYGCELETAVFETESSIPKYSIGNSSRIKVDLKTSMDAIDLISDLKAKDISSLPPMISEKINFHDCLFYIYTSGTTGLPKAAIIKHGRYLLGAMGSHYMNGLKSDDILYSALPLYHSAANIIAIGQAMVFGIPVAFRRKFSASNFWQDCVRYNVTVAQYIGEICRFLLSQPPSPKDKQHKVRLIIGNGLRREIWTDFITRFNIKDVAELYGSTEGNCNLVNFDGKVGAVGFIPRFMKEFVPMLIIKIDPCTGEPLRDSKSGLCIPTEFNEPGELIGIINKQRPLTDFEGYSDHNSKEKKLVQNIRTKGDIAFRSGDILLMDEDGYIYFKDRLGDTFRWKGENVSTTEVECVISKVTNLNQTIVYGVEIPKREGRAGMVAVLNIDGTLDLEQLANEVTLQLPSYARPLFVRELKEIDMTGTYKLKKIGLQNDGFNITKIKDPIYFYSNLKYVPLTNDLYTNIINGNIKL